MQQCTVLRPAGQVERETLMRVQEEAATSISLCYQCGKCSAGCPVAFAMDYTPRQVIRLLQLNLVEEALGAESIWICATCETCSTRCPRGVDITALMDTLRREALRQGRITDRKVAAFNQAFLEGVRKYGRLYEAGLLLEHNLKTGQPFKDAQLGLPMLRRGKASMFPEKIRNRDQIKKIFDRVREMRGESK